MNDKWDDVFVRSLVPFVLGLILGIWMCGGYS